MAEDIENTGEAAKSPEGVQPNTDAKSELPEVESPALSPAGDEPETVADSALIILPPASKTGAQSAPPHFRIRPRHKRYAVLAASVAVAAGIGVLAGSLLAWNRSAPGPDVAGLHRQQAMQKSISHLSKEVASLKANLAAGRKSADSEIAKISRKFADRLRSAPDITGSIPAPPAAVPTPLPRPAPRMASRVVSDWAIHDVFGGHVYVKGHGDIYEVARGAPLPGLGPISAVERRHGRWVVVTPKGLIVSLRDRRFFETN